MKVQVVPLEFRAMVDAACRAFDYEAAVMGLGGGDADPESGHERVDSTRHNASVARGEPKPATPGNGN